MPKLVTWMNNQRVGELTKLANGAHTFKYAPEWLASRYARPLSLSLPLQRGNITSDAVFNFFDNLLPDSPIVRDRIVKRYHAKSRQPFDLLSEIGRDSVGAVTLIPEDETVTCPIMAWEKLTEARLEEVLTAYKADIPLGMIREENDFRISVAGAQEKTALLRIGNDWCIPKGITPTTHISPLVYVGAHNVYYVKLPVKVLYFTIHIHTQINQYVVISDFPPVSVEKFNLCSVMAHHRPCVGYSRSGDSSQIYYGMSGGIIAHADGITFGQPLGDTMVLVKAPGADNVKIENQTGIHTDWRGYAILPFATEYRENRVALNANSLADNVELDETVVTVIPTHGAIARATFNVQIGGKVLMTLKYGNKSVPFGAIVTHGENKNGSIVAENGQVYLTGLPQSGKLQVSWGKDKNSNCIVEYKLPEVSPGTLLNQQTAICR